MLKLKMFEMFNDMIAVNPIDSTITNASSDGFTIVLGIAIIAGLVGAGTMMFNASMGKRILVGVLIGVVVAVLIFNGQLIEMIKGWAGA